MNNVTDKQTKPQQLGQQELDAIRKAPGKSVRGSSPYKLQKELLIVLLAPEILSDLKALAKKRKQCVDGLVEQMIEAYLASQHQLSRDPAMTEEAWEVFKKRYGHSSPVVGNLKKEPF
jgi:hypothetical protein